MRLVKLLLSLLLTVGLAYLLSIRLPAGDNQTPRLGVFLNPFTGFWQNAESSQPRLPTSVAATLQEAATVVYDDRMVPHIYANNAHDAYFLQGYVTAQHRLWQMEFQVMAAAGRVSEIIGAKAINYDREMRRTGMLYAAEQALAKWQKSEGYDLVEAYTAGINAYIDGLTPSLLPVEYKILDYTPEPWTPLKSALFLKNMSRTLAMHDDDLESLNAFKLLDRQQFDYLFPADHPTESPVIPADTRWDFQPLPTPKHTHDQAQQVTYRPVPRPFTGIGSNNWAVSGRKTKSGAPILCGDPHLGLTMPSIWYEIHMTTPDHSVYGASLPGIHGVIIGFNDSIAWSVTNVGRDVMDWYSIDWKDERRLAYRHGDGFKKVTLRVEEIRVRDGATVLDTVRYTHHGPVVYEDPEHPQHDMALRWMGHLATPGNEIMAFPMLNRANNYDDYVAAIQNFDCPAQNFVFASKSGDIALWTQGLFPLKGTEQGRFVLDGAQPDNDWKDFIPKAHNPHTLNPARGFVSSANQKSTAASYPYYYQGGFSDYRGRFLNRSLATMDSITTEDMKALQLSNYSLMAEEALPVLLQYLDETTLNAADKKMVELLRLWKYDYDRDIQEPTFFAHWWDAVYTSLWDELTAQDTLKPILLPEKRRTVQLLAENPLSSYYDVLATPDTVESPQMLVTTAFKTAMAAFDTLKAADPNAIDWGNYKASVVTHLARIAPFSESVYVSGDRHALNANAIRGGTTWGPSWRMIVELGKEIKAMAVYPGGQSGNPGSPYYASFVKDWQEGNYYPLKYWRAKAVAEQNAFFIQRFTPKAQ